MAVMLVIVIVIVMMVNYSNNVNGYTCSGVVRVMVVVMIDSVYLAIMRVQ
jgi:hypothetical protein